jgi:acyl-CoA dehydrogenase
MDQYKFNALLDTTKEIVQNILIPLEDEVANTDTMPQIVIETFKKHSLFALTIPIEYGGLGATVSQEICILKELGHASPAFASIIGTNHGIGSQSLIIKGNEQQKSHYLPKLASGDIISAFCLTENNAGSDAAAIETTAAFIDGQWNISGKKRYITNAPEAGLFTVAAKTNDNNISLFLVEANNPGVTIGSPDKKMGHAGSHTAEIIFKNCFVPSSALLSIKSRTSTCISLICWHRYTPYKRVDSICTHQKTIR